MKHPKDTMNSATTPSPTTSEPNWSDLGRPIPRWFDEAKLGIFIHWGPYSVPAWAEPIGPLGTIDGPTWFAHNPYSEWYANTIRIADSPAAEHHRDAHRNAPYEDFLDDWKGDRFDPTGWVDVFRRAGADFVVPVTKHHDGIALWDAPGTPERNTITRGPGRDIIGELADAVRAAGLEFGVYYSGGLDWSVTPHLPPIRDHHEVHSIRPLDEAYHMYASRHVRDLIDRYQPSMLWNDINWPDAGKHLGDGGLYELFHYYRSVVPHGVVNDRWGVPHHDFLTSEYASDADNETGWWQHTRGLGYSFGHNELEGAETMMSGAELSTLWVDIVARGGQLLLNVGPDAEGRIPDLQRAALEDFGSWRSALDRLPGRVRAWADPNDATEATGEPWTRFWNLDDRVVVFSSASGSRDVRVPGIGTVSLWFDDSAVGPAFAIAPKEVRA